GLRERPQAALGSEELAVCGQRRRQQAARPRTAGAVSVAEDVRSEAMSRSDSGPDPDNPPSTNKFRGARIGSIIGLVIGIVGYQVLSPLLFPRRAGDAFDLAQMFIAGGVGAVWALLGLLRRVLITLV